MKIGVKLVAVISLVNLIGIGLLAGVTLIQSQREIGRLADEEAQTIARESGERISKWFEGYLGMTRTLAQVMEGYQDIPVAERRDYFILMLRQVASNPGLMATYANCAPNAFDGMDSEYANTPGYDETGRFIPGWDYLTGEARLMPVPGFSWEMVLQIPGVNTEYMLDPTEAVFPEGKVLYANIGNPVKDRKTGALLGVAGTTFVLSAIQSMVEEIKPFGDGTAMLFSSGGIVAAHTDPERLGKNIRESETDTFGPFLDTMVEAVTKGVVIYQVC
jgi:hypothetical protein